MLDALLIIHFVCLLLVNTTVQYQNSCNPPPCWALWSAASSLWSWCSSSAAFVPAVACTMCAASRDVSPIVCPSSLLIAFKIVFWVASVTQWQCSWNTMSLLYLCRASSLPLCFVLFCIGFKVPSSLNMHVTMPYRWMWMVCLFVSHDRLGPGQVPKSA